MTKNIEKKVESENPTIWNLLDLAFVPSSLIRLTRKSDKEGKLLDNTTLNRVYCYSLMGGWELVRLGLYALIVKEGLNYLLS